MERIAILEQEDVTSVRPFVKWAGGKQALAEKLIEYFPASFRRYYEPFVGGGSVFFALNHPDCVIADYNKWLIDTYQAIKDDWKGVSGILDTLENEKEEFLRIRSMLPSELPKKTRAAHFIYLNKTCFRGLFRVNRKGQFNVPYGAYNRRYYDPDNISRVSKRLKRVDIRNGDFEMVIHDISKNDFVYFDPPYHKLGGYSDFNRYTEMKFHENDQFRLASLCNELDSTGVKWALSNSNTDFIKRLYQGYNIHEIDARREINLNSANRNIKELLITNY